MSDLRIGRERLGDLACASRLEWIVTNGIGGYAAGTVGGALTRRYHGLLVAALEPPVERTLMLVKLAERVQVDGQWTDLDLNHWAGGTSSPLGNLHLESFVLEGTVPCWSWELGDVRLEKRVWMEQGENTTYVQYRLAAASAPVTLGLRALVNHRNHHATMSRGATQARIEPVTGGVRIEMLEGATPLFLIAEGADAKIAHVWYRAFTLEREAERGLDDREDHLLAVELTRTLEPGEAFTVVASTRHDAARGALSKATALLRRRAHEKSLLDAWMVHQGRVATEAPAWIRRLVLAADAFVAERSLEAMDAVPGSVGAPRTLLAGYPWFTDRGRHAMVALPGLLVTTGRADLARGVLSLYAAHLDQGMLPNAFPEEGSAPSYDSVDASLWFFLAVQSYVDATGDLGLLEEVYPALEDVGAWYERGTRHGIKVDPRDGLVTQGAPGLALTWMDARVEDWVVTPRRGKPVEVNALWYAALNALARFGRKLGRPHESYADLARRVGLSFQRYWNADARCLYDVLDGPSGPDATLRPNQVFAVSLPDSPLEAAQRRAVVQTVGRTLLTSHGLRSLAPGHPEYRGHMTGDRWARDGAAHQGSVWPWLLPHYALAHHRAFGDRDAALRLLAPLQDLQRATALGTLPEAADGDPPHAPRGGFAQAWTVGETLRAWHELKSAEPKAARSPARRTRKSALVRSE